MAIKMALRLLPYSHELGTYCLLPRSSLRFQIFPALVRVHELSQNQPKLLNEIPLNVKGPVQNFTLQQDLERGAIRVWGQAKNGFFRYRCVANEAGDSFSLISEKEPEGTLVLSPLPKGNPLLSRPLYECLSLGSHKSQDWTLMRRRESMREILPHWFRLGQQVSQRAYHALQGTTALLTKCEERVAAHERRLILPAFKDLFRAGFEGMLSPRLVDEEHQGYHLPPLSEATPCSPLELLRRGAQMIRSLLIQSQTEGISLLPVLPSDFAFGRALNLYCQGIGRIDLEWSKGVLRRVIVHADTDGLALFHMQKELKNFRLKSNRCSTAAILRCSEAFSIEKGYLYFLDNFKR